MGRLLSFSLSVAIAVGLGSKARGSAGHQDRRQGEDAMLVDVRVGLLMPNGTICTVPCYPLLMSQSSPCYGRSGMHNQQSMFPQCFVLPQATQPAFFVPRYLQSAGVEVVPVPVFYPDVTSILGQQVYRRVQDVPGEGGQQGNDGHGYDKRFVAFCGQLAGGVLHCH